MKMKQLKFKKEINIHCFVPERDSQAKLAEIQEASIEYHHGYNIRIPCSTLTIAANS